MVRISSEASSDDGRDVLSVVSSTSFKRDGRFGTNNVFPMELGHYDNFKDGDISNESFAVSYEVLFSELAGGCSASDEESDSELGVGSLQAGVEFGPSSKADKCYSCETRGGGVLHNVCRCESSCEESDSELSCGGITASS